jgi:D-alanine-D-alanine ligase
MHMSGGLIVSDSKSKWRVAVLAGGDSDEREISLQSGTAVQQALTERGHFALHLDPAVVDLSGVDWRQFDVAFLALHGQFGEDGQVQQILEDHGVPYTGSNATASRLAFSKSAAKERFLQFNVPTPEYSLIHYTDDPSRADAITRETGYPLVIKPDSQGSSLGVTIVQSPDQVSAALRHAFQFDAFAVIERAIPGTEWTVGLLDDTVLPPILIETDREFFDWHAKYEDDNTRYLFETNFPRDVIQSIADAAERACQALGTSGVARVDLRVDHEMKPWVLEVNTIPGFTSHSLIPKAAARQGIEFGVFCERAIHSCLSGQPPRPHILPGSTVRRPAGN